MFNYSDLQSLEDKEKRLIEEKIKLHIEKLKQEEEYKRKMQGNCCKLHL